MWGFVHDLNSGAWAAIAAWLTLLVAISAAGVAYNQVKEARKLREEQAQPYVVAYMEPSPVSEQFMELVVRNFGMTAAHNVKLVSVPPLVRGIGGGTEGAPEEVRTFECLPVLVPGQEWRTLWDRAAGRTEAKLPDSYEVTISYQDSRRRRMEPTKSVLDWRAYKNRMFLERRGLHHAAKSLEEIAKTINSFKEPAGGVRVFSRDGDARDERRDRAIADRGEVRERKIADRRTPTDSPEDDCGNMTHPDSK